MGGGVRSSWQGGVRSSRGGGGQVQLAGGGQVQPGGGGQVQLAGGGSGQSADGGVGRVCQPTGGGVRSSRGGMSGPAGRGGSSRGGGGQHLAPSCGRYASCVHAGGLSCCDNNLTCHFYKIKLYTQSLVIYFYCHKIHNQVCNIEKLVPIHLKVHCEYKYSVDTADHNAQPAALSIIAICN